jgi:hypothetical protein
MAKLFECLRCGATLDRVLIDTPALCCACARRQGVEKVLERASVAVRSARARRQKALSSRTPLRISLAKGIYDAARRAYGQQVGGSLETLAAFGEVIAAAVTVELVDRAEAAAVTAGAIELAQAAVAKARRGPLVAMPIDLIDDWPSE